MSVSLPSREVTIIDVPEVRNFDAKFQYNFFVTNEGTDATGGVPSKALLRKGEDFDAAFVDVIKTRVPRFVKFEFSPVFTTNSSKQVDDAVVRNQALNQKNEKDYIRKNIDKVVNEDFFASQAFTAISLNDQSIDKKLFQAISGTAVWLTLNKEKYEGLTHTQLARETNQLTSDNVDFQFLSKFLVQPTENNVFFFERDAQRIRNDLVNKLKDANVYVQINNKFIHTLLSRAVTNPQSTNADSFTALNAVSKNIQTQAIKESHSEILPSDFKTFAPYVAISADASSTFSASSRIVGYIIDKYEIKNGKPTKLDPIVIENPGATLSVDVRVKYYATYLYTIRSIAEFTMPAIVEDTGELVVTKILVSSKPSRQVKVDCREFLPPPPPTDFNFHWNFETGKLGLVWTFPPNMQRDIKKFQVFRRATIQEPFQLLQMFDFDDSDVKAEFAETISPGLVTVGMSLRYEDPDFKKESKYIYAVACIDAHGFSSNYSDQFEVTFNRLKNRVVKKRISASGAPKSYPNMYLLADTFVDMAVDEGHRAVDIVFHPDHLTLVDSEDHDLDFLATEDKNRRYSFQFTNLDLQKQRSVEVSVEDLRRKLPQGPGTRKV